MVTLTPLIIQNFYYLVLNRRRSQVGAVLEHGERGGRGGVAETVVVFEELGHRRGGRDGGRRQLGTQRIHGGHAQVLYWLDNSSNKCSNDRCKCDSNNNNDNNISNVNSSNNNKGGTAAAAKTSATVNAIDNLNRNSNNNNNKNSSIGNMCNSNSNNKINTINNMKQQQQQQRYKH